MFLTTACGGTASSNGNDGSAATATGSSNGTGETVTTGTATDGGSGGTQGTAAPHARGAVSFSITTCQQYAGGIAKNGSVPTSAGFPGERFVDGEEGTRVSCRVAGGPPFEISGAIAGENSHPGATIASEAIEVRIENGVIEETGAGTADMTFSAGQSFRSQNANPCTLSINSTPSFEVASGRIFAAFNCAANLDVAGTPTVDCSASGVFVFERCLE